jgi:hypothetical protein
MAGQARHVRARVSERTAYKWLARYRAGGRAALADCRCGRVLHPPVLLTHPAHQFGSTVGQAMSALAVRRGAIE